ncbi:restriction endonuclease subunit S [Prevotella veroralis]|uniref:restriction endonuclease subunit S n=1 Tax=Prevotella veroralis TaxID=28137 RepID=UPI0020113695|nr:restriction endonuclease subunit S [Prevotella veroralis]
MNGKQLKNSILQWAIQGKLVPQDPNDEPASVLLEKIRAEKARLVKEGKIKKDKKESIIYRGEDNSYYEKFADGKVVCIDDEIPFEIPQGWELARFGSVMYNRDSERIPLSVAERNKLTKIYDYYGASGVIDKVDKYLFNKDLLLIGEDGANLINRSKPIAYIATGKYWVNNHAHVLDCIDSIFMQYICLYINSISLVDYVTGTAQPKMNQEKMNSILLVLPPHNEQKRILQKVDKIQPLYVRYEKNKSRLEALTKTLYTNLRKSILQEAMQGKLIPQDPNDEPASVLLQRIREERLKLVKDGKLKKKDIVDSLIFKGDDNKYYEQVDGTAIQIESDYDFPNTWAVVKLSHICRLIDGEKKEGQHICLDAKYLRGKSTGTYLDKGKFVAKGNNIILVDGENSGEVFTVPHDGYMGSTFKQLWISEAMHQPYVLYFIQFYKELLRNSKKGAAIPHLNKEIFYSLLIGIPPYQEQIRIARKIDIIVNEIKG